MRQIAFGVEFFLAVNAALNFAGTDGFDDGGDAFQKIIPNFFAFQTVVQTIRDFAETFGKSALRFERNFVAHQDAYAIHFLPLFFQAEQRADFKIARGNINRAGQVTPVGKVRPYFPVGVAVINNEKF
ncbi:MAG TPA: hypothetical protein PLD20_04350 [Blastocatellia bacterium]|nr:hypothetical protein [Blastocatellia bacterium]HMV86696.1 hypothetical protein [Blastocatellia bacterium]HMX28192.1 hypothetical protein [Blastocatellia bacterium]HMY71829.1 hypothetical protein [Blastocatellia bacterium]HMZ17137.1 hypothetical protein [Blastocatellia bacterium]